MLRFAILLLLICLLYRWAFGNWPWEGLGGRNTRKRDVAEARRLLRVEKGASREQIIAAHKRLLATAHPDRGGTNAEVHNANDARDLLLAQLSDRLETREDS
jgi:DnaJ homolog subfamily C member 19